MAGAERGTVLTWTRLDRPPAGFPPGRTVVLVERSDAKRVYALWRGPHPPAIGAAVAIEAEAAGWVARGPDTP
jgi:hypothetical protein